MRIENSFFSSIHYPPGPSGTAVGGKGLKTYLPAVKCTIIVTNSELRPKKTRFISI